jgi:hypothetical protein
MRKVNQKMPKSGQLTKTGPKQLLNAVIGPYQSLDWKD